MFQCKDLLSLTTMSQANVIAGSGGMEKGIRWSYKAENINFEKWVRGNELLIVSAPVTQRKNFYYLPAIICTVFHKTYDPVAIAGNDCRIITFSKIFF